MAHVGESSYCFADLRYSRETVPQQPYRLFFGGFVNCSNMKLLAARPQYRSSPWITFSLEFGRFLEALNRLGSRGPGCVPGSQRSVAPWAAWAPTRVSSPSSVLSVPLGQPPAAPSWLHPELGSKPALASMAMPEEVKIKEEKSERCWGFAGLTTASPRRGRGGSKRARVCWVSGTLSKPVVVQGRRTEFCHLKKEKCVAGGGNKAPIPQSEG